jgi:hypothetical protein
MSTSVDRAANDSTVTSGMRYSAAADVQGQLLNRASNLYAQQERDRRVSRTQRMIRLAESAK